MREAYPGAVGVGDAQLDVEVSTAENTKHGAESKQGACLCCSA